MNFRIQEPIGPIDQLGIIQAQHAGAKARRNFIDRSPALDREFCEYLDDADLERYQRIAELQAWVDGWDHPDWY